MNRNLFNDALSTKSTISYPKILSDQIKLLSFNSENSLLIGSASYKVQKYPADIDLFEIVNTCCSKEDAIEYFYQGIRHIVKELMEKRNYWVIEVKCGLDPRYDTKQFNTENDIIDWLTSNRQLISDTDYINLLETLSQPINAKSREYIDNIFRTYHVIRWSGEQIIGGSQVRRGKTFNLRDCIDTISNINLEIIAIIDGKFVDLSNFFVLTFHDKLTDKDYIVNFEEDVLTKPNTVVKRTLCTAINNLYYSYYNRDVFKMIKRMFSLGRINRDSTLLNKITPLVESDLSEISQIKSELGTLYEIATFTDNFPNDIFFKQLDAIKWKIGGNTFFTTEEVNSYSSIIDDILSNKNYLYTSIIRVKHLKDDILNKLNFTTDIYVKKLKIIPPLKSC